MATYNLLRKFTSMEDSNNRIILDPLGNIGYLLI